MVKGVVSGYVVILCCVIINVVFEKFKDVDDLLGYFCDILIFGGCMVGLIVVLVNMQIIEDENLCENLIVMGDCFYNNLFGFMEKYGCIGEVCGMGLF